MFLRPETDPVLRFEIFRDGEPLWEAEPGLFVDERVRAVKLYQDALPFRRALPECLGASVERAREDSAASGDRYRERLSEE